MSRNFGEAQIKCICFIFEKSLCNKDLEVLVVSYIWNKLTSIQREKRKLHIHEKDDTLIICPQNYNTKVVLYTSTSLGSKLWGILNLQQFGVCLIFGNLYMPLYSHWQQGDHFTLWWCEKKDDGPAPTAPSIITAK